VTPAPPGTAELFLAFMQVGLSGFGGVLAWAHRMVVRDRRWMSEQEFVETLGLCQVLRGPNIGNLSIYIGARFQGWRGAVAAFAGLMLAPFVIVIAAASLLGAFGDVPAVKGALAGISAASAGLLVAMVLRMGLHQRRKPVALAFALLTFVAVGLMRAPLPLVLLVLAPPSIAAAWRRR
jgi:chromate transporter